MNNPKVSIIIPVYNGSNYLKEAIDSALGQTYKNMEVIVVNDGSNDEGATDKIAKSYGKKIKYFKKENGGVATALNLGIEKMTGEYFSWLSHDDLYYPRKVERQVEFIEKLKNKNVVLYSNYSILVGRKITHVVHDHEMLTRKKKYSLLRGCVNGITTFVPKTILDEIGKFDSELRCTQDYDYWRRIQKKYEFVHMTDVLSITRLHSNQDSVVSPRAESEGNVLWIDMVKSISDKEKIQYESTLYNFYYEMVKFLETTPYKGVLEYCRQQFLSLEDDYKIERVDHKVSVVIPFFNRPEKTINAIKSVLKQSYKNFEIVLVNDGSTEDISKLAKFIKGRKNIKYFEMKKNSGPGAARNVGIKKSSGDYIAFLDSDDEFLESKLEEQLLSMHRHNRNISYTSYIRRYDGEDEIIYDEALTGIVVPRIISNCSIATPTVVVKKNLLIDNEIFFNEKLMAGEDTCFWLDIAKFSEILLVNKPLTVVNVNESSNAIDRNKLFTGVKNTLMYLMSDKYYTEYNYDISLLCGYYHGMNEDAKQVNRENLLIDESFLLPELPHIPIPIRAVRALYTRGPKEFTKSVVRIVRNRVK